MRPSTNHYEILGKLGEGGFGVVYKARFLGEGDFEKIVAIKVLNQDMEVIEDVARRLRDEARLLGLIRHRAIVQVDRLVRLNGRWSVVMECIEGVGLSAIQRESPVPVGPALEIVAEVAGALHVAYTTPGPEGNPLRLLHRDIKPSNIFVTSAGEVKILDFGIARADFEKRESHTEMQRFGSQGYLAPERHDGIDGPAGDVYALGAVLWGILVGERFGRTSASRHRHEQKIADGLERLREEEIPAGVIQLVQDMFAFEPEDRPSARDVERTALKLRQSLGEPTLRDWCEEVVAPLHALELAYSDETSEEDLGERFLTEEQQTETTAPVIETPKKRDWTTLALGAGMALVGVLGFVLVLIALYTTGVLDTEEPPSDVQLPPGPDASGSVVVEEGGDDDDDE